MFMAKESDSQTLQMIAIGLSVPLTSVNCERGISAYNEIKPDSRNSQSVTKTNMLIMLYLDETNLEEFDLDRLATG